MLACKTTAMVLVFKTTAVRAFKTTAMVLAFKTAARRLPSRRPRWCTVFKTTAMVHPLDP
jgi:hypothetical protein